MNNFLVLFLFFLPAYQLNAKMLPLEGSKLNYRIIGFKVADENNSGKGSIWIAEGDFNTKDSAEKHVISKLKYNNNKVVGEVPYFGRQYTWYAINDGERDMSNIQLHHFSTIFCDNIDTSKIHLRVIQSLKPFKDDYVFMDGSRALYDMTGKPVWFLPQVDKLPADRYDNFGDLKATNQGTITFLTNRRGGDAYEIDYNGKVVWKGPDRGEVSGGKDENYNHEFTRLSDGNYMVLGNESVLLKLPGNVDSHFRDMPENKTVIIRDSVNHTFSERLNFGTLIEYDQSGKVIWYWKSSDYFRKSDIYAHVSKYGAYFIRDPHVNSFFFDEQNKVIYISFRAISRILKIKYPEGNVIAEYGVKLSFTDKKLEGSPLFYGQHSCKISDKGFLYLFNNNDQYDGALPTVLMMREPPDNGGNLKKVWEYSCTVQGLNAKQAKGLSFSSGGNVMELPGNSMFVSMGSAGYTKVFILDKFQKIAWSAILEERNASDDMWTSMFQYRASIITKEQLYQLIWR